MKSISILTVVIGEPESLYDTYKSLMSCLSENITWVIKFNSKCNPSFVKKFYKEYVKILYVADDSLYDAMNQGLNFLTSDFYFVIGSGDLIVADSLRDALNFINNNESDIYFLPVSYINSQLALKP